MHGIVVPLFNLKFVFVHVRYVIKVYDNNVYEITGVSALIQNCCKTQEKRSAGYDIFYLHVTEHGSRKKRGVGKGLAGNP